MLTVLSLCETLSECVARKAFCDLKKFKDVADIVMNERYWDLHYTVCKVLYPAYLLLKCANQKLGGMDRVKYLMMQITCLLPKVVDEIVDKWEALGEDNLKLVHCANSDSEFDTPKATGGLKTEGLDDEDEFIAFVFIFLGCITASPIFCIVSDDLSFDGDDDDDELSMSLDDNTVSRSEYFSQGVSQVEAPNAAFDIFKFCMP